MTPSVTLAPSAHPSIDDITRARRRHYLFGYPIAHSASPAFQNALYQSVERRRIAETGENNEQDDTNGVPTYSLCETKSVDDAHLYQLVRHDPRMGGSAVTMPLKVAVASQLGPQHILDELDSIGQATLTVNTIVVQPGLDGDVRVGHRRMVGTNTDCLGIRHALLRDVAVQNGLEAGALIGSTRDDGPFVFPRGADDLPFAAFIIGSGGTCRSAVWALHNLGLSPLYLLNRDEQETQDVVHHFRKMSIDLRPLHSLEAYAREKALRDDGTIGKVACAVGAIPAFEPATAGEKMVYSLAHAFFKEQYDALAPSPSAAQPSVPTAAPAITQPYRTFALPSKRPFLDMCYKPRLTPLLQFAGTQTTTWSPIGGVEAMVEQGLAQARMWAASAALLDGDVVERQETNALVYATRTGNDGPLGLECEEQARRMVQTMSDVVIAPTNLVVPTFGSNLSLAASGLQIPSKAINIGTQPQSVH